MTKPMTIGKMMKKRMKTGMIKCTAFNSIYQKQLEFQKDVCKKAPYEFAVGDLPEDNIRGFSFHLQQLVSEIGEVLSADKRWKNYRNNKLDAENKKEEIADCFIVLMNVAIFSGLSAEELEEAILNKIDENAKRVQSLKNP